MVIHVTPPLESALREQAHKRGIPPEALAIDTLRDRFLPSLPVEPQDAWERTLFMAAIDCGTSVPDSALSSESLYE